MKIPVAALIGLSPPHGVVIRDVESSAQSFLALHDRVFANYPACGDVVLSIQLASESDARHFQGYAEAVLLVESVIDTDDERPSMREDDNWKEQQNPRRDAERLASTVFDEAILTLIMCCVIAAPHHFKVDGVLHLSPSPSEFPVHGELEFASFLEASHSNKWPDIGQVDAKLVHDWVWKLPGWQEGTGGDQGGRALAAFSQLLFGAWQLGTPVRLVWALAGLEALFTKGSANIQQQLFANSEVLLGPRLGPKKILAEMYDFRSKFFHGKKDMPFAHRLESESTWDIYWVEMRQHVDTAAAMLLASLQKLVERGWTSFEVMPTLVGQREREK